MKAADAGGLDVKACEHATSLNAGDAYCTRCGAELKTKCPRCGRRSRPGTVLYCPDCGTEIVSAKPAKETVQQPSGKDSKKAPK